MKKYCVILVCMISTVVLSKTSFPFDSLFPMTWYQKGLESCLSAWQILSACYEKNDMDIPFDKILAQLAFAQFCMRHTEESKSLPEDIDYFIKVLNIIKNLVEIMVITKENKDWIDSINEIIISIQQQIK